MNWLAALGSVKVLVFCAALSCGVIVPETDGMCRGLWTKADDDPADSGKPQEAGL